MQCFICDNCTALSLYPSLYWIIPYFCKCVVENCHGDFGFVSNIIRRILHALRYAILERRLDGMPFCMPYWSEGEGKSLGEISILQYVLQFWSEG